MSHIRKQLQENLGKIEKELFIVGCVYIQIVKGKLEFVDQDKIVIYHKSKLPTIEMKSSVSEEYQYKVQCKYEVGLWITLEEDFDSEEKAKEYLDSRVNTDRMFQVIDKEWRVIRIDENTEAG